MPLSLESFLMYVCMTSIHNQMPQKREEIVKTYDFSHKIIKKVITKNDDHYKDRICHSNSIRQFYMIII